MKGYIKKAGKTRTLAGTESTLMESRRKAHYGSLTHDYGPMFTGKPNDFKQLNKGNS